MTSQEAPTTTSAPIATTQRRPNPSGRRRRPIREGTRSIGATPSRLRSAGRFLALAARPIRAGHDAVSVLLSALVAGGIWATLTFVVIPGVRHVTVNTPFGPHDLTVAVSRAPWAVAIGCVVGAVLLAIAGMRLQLGRDEARNG